MKNEFDLKAAGWDNNPMHWDRSVAITNNIKELIPLDRKMNALEYGAGTGTSSFLLKDYLKEITLMDSSSEMVRVMNEKIKTTKVKNLKTLNFDLEHSDYSEGRFDLIFTQMVLHHVSDIDSIIRKFFYFETCTSEAYLWMVKVSCIKNNVGSCFIYPGC